jgi:hypothetical protein
VTAFSVFSNLNIIMPQANRKYDLHIVKQQLEMACPGVIRRIPPTTSFEFWTDCTKNKNVWIKIGSTDPKEKTSKEFAHAGYPVWVRFDEKTVSTMWCSHNGHEEKILHWNKELARIGITYSPPFNHLSPIQYKPPASTKADSLKWFTELRALTLFALVWCGIRDKFVNFKHGKNEEALQVLLHVLERIPEERSVKRLKGLSYEIESNSRAREDPALTPDAEVVVDGTHLASGADANLDRKDLFGEYNPKKRTHDEFAESQND